MPTLHDDMTFAACMAECIKTREEGYQMTRRAIHNRNCEFHYAADCPALSIGYGQRAMVMELASRKLNESADAWQAKAFGLLNWQWPLPAADDEQVTVTDIQPARYPFARMFGRMRRDAK